jgi:hypothetical protein
MTSSAQTRRRFLGCAAAGAAGVGLSGCRTAGAPGGARRGKAPFRVLYGNDTTNLTSCVSPYHAKGEPFTEDRLRASVDEARAADAHLLQPGLGWIPWWKSDIVPAAEHYRWLEREHRVKPDSFGEYMLAGGDLVAAFTEHCRRVGVAPFISYRLNDGHHVRGLANALARGRADRGMSRFYWENYARYRLGPDTTDWGQGVFNWAIPEVRDHKFALIRELCERHDIDGLELDFLRHPPFFRPEEAPAPQRRAIMMDFVRRVRETLDRTARGGRRRWLCVRVPALLEAHDASGIDLAAFVAAGVDMVNLSSSYFTCQATDLPAVRRLVPDATVYLEMTHTPMTGRPLAGSGTQVYQRTTDAQYFTTAHLAYAQGADGVSLFNFVYTRDHAHPGLGPFCEPPFHVLPRLADRDWLARQPQWYFLAAIREKSKQPERRLQATLEPGAPRAFLLAAAPTAHQRRDGLLRLRTEKPVKGASWTATLNGVPLAPAPFVRKPIDHPYEAYLGTEADHACFACPRSAVRAGENRVALTLSAPSPALLIWLDLTLP